MNYITTTPIQLESSEALQASIWVQSKALIWNQDEKKWKLYYNANCSLFYTKCYPTKVT